MASVLPFRSNNPNGAAPAPSPALRRRPSLNSFPSQSNVSHYDATSLHEASNLSYGGSSLDDLSYRSSLARKRRKVRPLYPADSEEKHVEYILVAGFDIDRGSVMEHQYPAPIGGDEHMLADLMLPDQTHVRSQDWTMFFLHKDTTEDDEEKEKRAERRRDREARKARDAAAAKEYPLGSAAAAAAAAAADEDSDDTDSEGHDEAMSSIQGPPLVYVLNLVNTKQDKTAKRGAVVKAMAICTRHSFLHVYKPLLLLALEEYFRNPVPETLASLYDSVNSMDLSLLPRLSFQESFILQASDVKDLFIEKFEAMIQQRMAADSALQSSNETGQVVQRQRYALPRDTHEFESVVKYNNIPIPIKIPTALSVETVGDFSLIKLIQTFSNPHATAPQPFTTHHPHLTTSGPATHPVIVLLNALLTQKRIIFIGHNLPSSDVAEAVLAACALVSGGLLRGFTRHAFPYTDLTKINDLQRVPGFIAGVTNPMFSGKSEWWDLLCDLQTGRMKISPHVEPAPLTEGVLFFQHNTSAAAVAHNAGGAVGNTGASLAAGLGGTTFPTTPSGAGDATGDAAFMSRVLNSINDRRGEGVVRAKFRLWVLKFIRLSAAFEEMVYGASALHTHYTTAKSPTIPDTPSTTGGFDPYGLDPATTGHGYVWPTNDAKFRELAANATRIEGWSKTRSYYNFVQDFAVIFTLRPIQDLDLQHLHDKLIKLRLGSDAAQAIYMAICSRVRTYEQINQLLTVVVYAPPAAGASATLGSAGGSGLFYLALGLMHPRAEVREAVADLLGRVRVHEAGRHFWVKLGRFEKAAWERVIMARQEREESQ
ncbi:hypothetical protein MBLNU459_g4870t1 [Dothideomycetes sp. NU459]